MDGSEPEADRERAIGEVSARVMARAQAGDPAALAQVTAWMDAHLEICARAGDVAAVVERTWIGLLAGENPVYRELVGRSAVELTRRLAGPEPTPIVQLLARRAVACWLQVQHADGKAAEPAGTGAPLGRFLMERQDRAHRRLLAALAELARIQKLLGQDARTPVGDRDRSGPSHGGGLRLSVFGG
jgi:hypothetical protein